MIRTFVMVILFSGLAGCGGSGDSGSTNNSTHLLVSAGSDQTVDEKQSVSLTGSATGNISTYQWTQTQGPNVTISNANQASASFVSLETKQKVSLEFQLSVTDNKGKTASDKVTIVVNPVNELPNAKAGDDLIVVTQTQVTLSGVGTDPDGTIASYEWKQTEGETVELTSQAQGTVSFLAPATNTGVELSFSLTVTDDEGARDVDNLVVSVLPSEFSVSAGELQAGIKGDTISLAGKVLTQDITVSKVEWSQVSGTQVALLNADSLNVSFTPNFFEQSTVRLKLAVTDSYDRVAISHVDVAVNERKTVFVDDFNEQPNGKSLVVSSIQGNGSCTNDSWSHQIENQTAENFELSFDVIDYSTLGMGEGVLRIFNNYLSFKPTLQYASNYTFKVAVIGGEIQALVVGGEDVSEQIRDIATNTSSQNIVNVDFRASACGADLFASAELELDGFSYAIIGN